MTIIFCIFVLAGVVGYTSRRSIPWARAATRLLIGFSAMWIVGNLLLFVPSHLSTEAVAMITFVPPLAVIGLIRFFSWALADVPGPQS